MLYRIMTGQNDTGYLERRTPIQLADLGYREKDLQKWLLRHIDQIIRTAELFPLTESKRGEEMPDILAVDKTGRLFIFELKRWESQSSNLLQVMRYAQISCEWNYEDLEHFYQREIQEEKELANHHREHFGHKEALREEDWNHDQELVVVTNGLDFKTRQAVKYWKSKGVNIRPWIYRVYSLDNEIYLDINAFGETDDPFEDKPAKYHLVNTNYGNDPISHEYMLKNKRAAAFYGKWKYKIDNIERGDWVFLYQSGIGIVAFGQSDTRRAMTKSPPHGLNDHGEEHYVELNPFYLLSEPLQAGELRRIAKYHVPLISVHPKL